jgi:hypothetical protein
MYKDSGIVVCLIEAITRNMGAPFHNQDFPIQERRRSFRHHAARRTCAYHE